MLTTWLANMACNLMYARTTGFRSAPRRAPSSTTSSWHSAPRCGSVDIVGTLSHGVHSSISPPHAVWCALLSYLVSVLIGCRLVLVIHVLKAIYANRPNVPQYGGPAFRRRHLHRRLRLNPGRRDEMDMDDPNTDTVMGHGHEQ